MTISTILRRALYPLSLATLLSACATTFTGSAHVDGGPGECAAKCGKWGMDLAGMVAMGEYSDGCICRVRRTGGPVSEADGEGDGAIAGAGASAAAVVTAMQAAQQQQQQQQQAAMHH